MKRVSRLVLLAACSWLAACEDIRNTTNNSLDAAGNEATASTNKLREMVGLSTKKPPKPSPVQPRYCYQAYQDIVCYHKPVPGYEERLVAYQNQKGTGYVIDPVPTPAANEELKPLKSVNVPSAPSAKSDSQLKEVIFDPADLEPKQLVPDKQE